MTKQNMITGSPIKTLTLFALPMIIGNIFQQLYYIVDMIIVGQAVGSDALAAVGATSTICNVYLNIAVGYGTGALVIISQLFGAKNTARMKTAISTSVITLLALSLILMAVSFISADGMLSLTNVNDSLYSDAKDYYLVYTLGFPGLFLYNISNSSFNALGKSRLTLGFLIFSSCLNIALDLWFIAGLGWGVKGAALATIISQYLAAFLSFGMLIRHIKKYHKTEEKQIYFDLKMLTGTAKVAIPTIMHMLIMSVGYVALQSLVNTLGNSIISGYVAAVKLDSLCIVPMVQVANAAATFCGQNIGAEKYERVPMGYKSALLINFIFSMSIMLVMIFWRNEIVGLFMDANAGNEAIKAGADYILITSIFYVVMGTMSITFGVLRGTGDVTASVVCVLLNFTGRVIFAYVVFYITGSELAIWWSNCFGWCIGLVTGYIRYKSGKWKGKRLADKI